MSCISQWLIKNKLCPLCKRDTSASIQPEPDKVKPEPKREQPRVEAQQEGRELSNEQIMRRWFGGNGPDY